jgi:hypothetical protein
LPASERPRSDQHQMEILSTDEIEFSPATTTCLLDNSEIV